MNTSYESQSCAICKTRKLTNGIWECLSDTPHLCPNSLDFGFSYHICRHPETEIYGGGKQGKDENTGRN